MNGARITGHQVIVLVGYEPGRPTSVRVKWPSGKKGYLVGRQLIDLSEGRGKDGMYPIYVQELAGSHLIGYKDKVHRPSNRRESQ